MLNPVERLWGLVKIEWAKELLRGPVKQKQIEKKLKAIVDQLKLDALRGVTKSSHKMMLQVLDGTLV